MADAGREVTGGQRVRDWGITLVVPLLVWWGAVEATTRPEVAGRYAEAVLQLLGFAALAFGLHETVAQVTDRPGLRKRVEGWLRKLMFWREPEGRTVSMKAGSVGVGGVDARLTVAPGPDASLDRRVEILEQKVEANRSRIEEVRQEAQEGRDELKERISDLRSELSDVEEELKDFVRRPVVSSLHWEVTGLFWFALGVIVGTWPGLIPGA